jgi:hypothetical protein
VLAHIIFWRLKKLQWTQLLKFGVILTDGFLIQGNLKQKTLFMTGNLDDWLRNMLGLFCFCITNILVNKWPKNFGSAA